LHAYSKSIDFCNARVTTFRHIRSLFCHQKLQYNVDNVNKKHLKNVGPIHHCEPPHANSPDVASGTVARRLRIDVHDANDNDDNDNA